MSETPRTQQLIDIANDEGISDAAVALVLQEHSEELEREIAEARAEIERLRQELRDNSTLAARQIVPAEMLVDDLTAEIERKDAIIEQMREALKNECLNHCEERFSRDCPPNDCRDCKTKAALEAAERGEG